MPVFRFGQTVVLHTRTKSGVDGDGNDVFSNTAATFTNVPVWPSDGNGNSSNERLQGRDTVISGYSIFLPAGTDVQAVDYVEVNGGTFEVSGLPGIYLNPFTGTNPGVLVNVTKVTG